ncbi:DUF6270 domain-containing protein [Arthrobacter sp. H16F315]|uniref:DUF6270 domain-containing protein n=1 Tax=Arthrobacter sp. H16F315 TaxID=2955314 RepID=UPI00209813F2|nr:DUF6270 domain-containing protein [Arthrobacter sp. H16F315]MDD1477229.1 DUF6270 domain-containing protein [Arthrobacter sp. H16F315]
MQKNLMIYGSCVSRDAFPLLDPEFRLVSYVARQSMISAMSKPTDLLPGDALSSAFQDRSLVGDIRSNLLQLVRRFAGDLDVLVIDLTDERLGVVRLPDGSHVTRSHELVSSERLKAVQGRTQDIRILTERHWTLWESAATRLLGALSQMGLREKTVILNTPWAETTHGGEPAPPFWNFDTPEVNAYFSECCAHMRSLGFKVVDLPEDLRYAAADHKWGAAPYHFEDSAIAWIADQIQETAAVAASAVLRDSEAV